MGVHLIKMAVGVESVDHLARLQAARLKKSAEILPAAGGRPRLCHFTRHMPRRAGELLLGGSIYWVIKGFIRVRQGLTAIERSVNPQGRPACALVMDPGLVGTSLRAFRPFQGWRYLAHEAAPPDLGRGEISTGLPPEMAEELRSLGLL